MGYFNLRPACVEDLYKINNFQMIKSQRRIPNFTEEELKSGLYFVAVKDDIVIGITGVKRRGKLFFLGNTLVHEMLRGKGLASAMIMCMCRLLGENVYAEVMNVDPSIKVITLLDYYKKALMSAGFVEHISNSEVFYNGANCDLAGDLCCKKIDGINCPRNGFCSKSILCLHIGDAWDGLNVFWGENSFGAKNGKAQINMDWEVKGNTLKFYNMLFIGGSNREENSELISAVLSKLADYLYCNTVFYIRRENMSLVKGLPDYCTRYNSVAHSEVGVSCKTCVKTCNKEGYCTSSDGSCVTDMLHLVGGTASYR